MMRSKESDYIGARPTLRSSAAKRVSRDRLSKYNTATLFVVGTRVARAQGLAPTSLNVSVNARPGFLSGIVPAAARRPPRARHS